jgi:hypothetical protein
MLISNSLALREDVKSCLRSVNFVILRYIFLNYYYSTVIKFGTHVVVGFLYPLTFFHSNTLVNRFFIFPVLKTNSMMAVFRVVAPCNLVEVYSVSEVLAASIIRAIHRHHSLTQKTAIFVLTAVRTSNPTKTNLSIFSVEKY